MDATERRLKILDMFNEGDGDELKIAKIVSALKISRETARKDLSKLQDKGKVKLIRGGALLKVSKNETAYEKRLDFMKAEKEEIAASFCSRINEGDTVYLDFGTTCLAAAKKLHRFKKLTVVTNSLPIINELYKDDHITLLVLGGMVRKNEGSFVGDTALIALESININVGLFSGGGLDPQLGLSNFNFSETELSRKVMKKCLKVIVGVDHSKLNQVYSQQVASINDIDVLLCDRINPKDLKLLKQKIPKVIVGKEGN